MFTAFILSIAEKTIVALLIQWLSDRKRKR